MDPTSNEKPLDPEAAQFLGRVRRLIAVSLLFTGVALAIVLGAIGYRVSRTEGSKSAADTEHPLPAGAKVVGTALGDGLLALTLDVGGAAEIHLFDAATLKPRGRVRLRPAP